MENIRRDKTTAKDNQEVELFGKAIDELQNLEVFHNGNEWQRFESNSLTCVSDQLIKHIAFANVTRQSCW